MKSFKIATWTAALGCLCFEGVMFQASALCLRSDQLTLSSELEVGGDTDDQAQGGNGLRPGLNAGFISVGQRDARSGGYLNFKPWGDFTSTHNRGRAKILLANAADDLLTIDGQTITVIWSDGAEHKGKDDQGQHLGKGDHGRAHPPFPHDLPKGGPKPSRVPDAGSTLVLLGLGVGSLGLFRQKSGKRQIPPVSHA
jgi:hypothetical protein